MGIINRFLLFLYTLAVAAASIGVLGLALHLLPFSQEQIWSGIRYAAGREEMIAVAGVLLAVSVWLLLCSLSRQKKTALSSEVILLHGATGDIKVAVAAVRDLVGTVAHSVQGVRSVSKIQVAAKNHAEKNASVNIALQLIVGQEGNVPAITETVRREVGRHLTHTVGLQDTELDIAISGITNAPIKKRQRVV